jgi:RNA polymerase sigma factor (sigma-70 family)
MATSSTSHVIQHLRRLLQDEVGLTDSQLLGDFVERRDEVAFTVLVKRHGPMVWNVCRRLLDQHDAEDAFQATFLVLCRKAASIRHRELVPGWLHGVAHQTALEARRTLARRRAKERQVVDMLEPAMIERDSWQDLRPLLDRELDRLADRYRAVIVLCDLEGKTRKEAARLLGCPEGTVAGRLARARAMLAKRLAHHGLKMSAGALAGVLSQSAASACLPESVTSCTIQAATLFAAGQTMAGAASVKATLLARGVLKFMLLKKLKSVATGLLVMAVIGVVGGVCVRLAPEGRSERAANRNLAISTGGWSVFEGSAVSAPIPTEKERARPFVKWTARAAFVGNEPYQPLVVKDRVIVGSSTGVVHAFRCEDGKEVWTYQKGAVEVGGRLGVIQKLSSDGERVYFVAVNGLTAVKVEDGTLVWDSGLTTSDGQPLVLSKYGMVYVGGSDGNLYALDAKAGKQQWICDFLTDAPPDRPGFPGERARMAGTKARPTALTSDGETLFLSVFDQSRIIAVNAKTGKRLWSFQAHGWLYGSAVATATHVLFGSQDRNYYCLDKKVGKQVWKYESRGRIESGGVVDGTHVYFASCDGNVYCLRLSDGKERWHFTTDGAGQGRNGSIYSVPLLRRQSLAFAAGEGQLYVIDRETGKLRGKVRPCERSEIYCSAVGDGTHLFVVTRRRSKGEGEAVLVGIGLK